MIQLALAFFGLTALYMATGHNVRARRWAPLVGLCGQPFWLVFAVQAQAWGLFALSLAYSAVYVRGAWVQWQPEIKRFVDSVGLSFYFHGYRWYRRWIGGRWEYHFIDVCCSSMWLQMDPNRCWPEYRQPCSVGEPVIEDWPQ